MPTFREIINDIKKGKFAPVYILMGEEPYYLNLIAEHLENQVIKNEEDKVFDQTILFGAESQAATIVEIANRYPVTGERQLVILKEAQAMNQAKSQLDKLQQYVSNPNHSTVLAIVFKGDKINASSALMKAASKNKDVVVFESPLIKEYNLPAVIKDYCVSEGIKISERSVQLLIEYVGNSLEKIFSEISKLIVAQKGTKEITPDSIEKNIGISKDFNNFELVNFLSKRSYYEVMKIISHFADNPKSNPTVVTTGVLFNYFQKLLIANASQDKSDTTLLAALQVKSVYALKDIRAGMNYYTGPQCEKAIHYIREFDTKSKGIESLQNEYLLLRDLLFKIITVS